MNSSFGKRLCLPLLTCLLTVPAGLAWAQDMQINTSTVDTSSGQEMGSVSHTGSMESFFTLQKEMVANILKAVGKPMDSLPQSVRDSLSKPPTTNVQAFIAFSNGLNAMDKGNFADAAEAFSKAASMDPAFKLASSLAQIMPKVNANTPGALADSIKDAKQQAMDKAKVAAEKLADKLEQLEKSAEDKSKNKEAEQSKEKGKPKEGDEPQGKGDEKKGKEGGEGGGGEKREALVKYGVSDVAFSDLGKKERSGPEGGSPPINLDITTFVAGSPTGGSGSSLGSLFGGSSPGGPGTGGPPLGGSSGTPWGSLSLGSSTGGIGFSTILPPTDTTNASADSNSSKTKAALELAYNQADIYFLADNTGSMNEAISGIQEKTSTILNALAGSDSRFKGVNIQWGVGQFWGDPSEDGQTPATSYKRLQAITANQSSVTQAIAQWDASQGLGGDPPEANFYAIQQAVLNGAAPSRNSNVGTGFNTGWRSGSAKVIVLFGDAPSWQNSVNEKELAKILKDNSVHLVFINTGQLNDAGASGDSPSSSYQSSSGSQLAGAAQELADGSGGVYVDATKANANQLVDAVLNAVYDAITVNPQHGGYMAAVNNAGQDSGSWRNRSPSAVSYSNAGDLYTVTLSEPGKNDAGFSFDASTASQPQGKPYFVQTNIAPLEYDPVHYPGDTTLWGDTPPAPGDYSSQVVFSQDKDFFIFTIRPENSAEPLARDMLAAGYFGIKAKTSGLPSSGITQFDSATGAIAPGDGGRLRFGALSDGMMTVNWATGKVYGWDGAPGTPGTAFGLFVGSVDRDNVKISGRYVANTDSFTSSDSSDPMALSDAARGNTNLQIYGKSSPAGVGGTFGANWYWLSEGSVTSAYTSMGMVGIVNKTVSYTVTPSDNENWKGFATAFFNSEGTVAALNTNSSDVSITFKPSTGEVSGSIAVSENGSGPVRQLITDTCCSDNAYVSPKAFGVSSTSYDRFNYVASQPTPPSSADTNNYDYTTWGYWQANVGESGLQAVGLRGAPWIVGRLTPDASIPTTGTATYTGSLVGQVKGESNYSVDDVTGTINVQANYGSNSLSGSFNDIKFKKDNTTWISSATISGSWPSAQNKITGTVSATNTTGQINGAFYGPTAQEIGGNWLINKGISTGAGIFMGKK